MTSAANAVRENARWEVVGLRRSQRIWLLVIPPIAGPIGSAIAVLYLRVPSVGTAEVLGLLITAGLAALILLDLTALAVGEDLARRAHLLFFTLPQDRWALLTGRLLVAIGGPIGAFALGAGVIGLLSGSLVNGAAAGPILFDPVHLFVGLLALLLFLAGVTVAASVITRTSSEALVAGVLAGVVIAGGTGYLEFERDLSMLYPVLLAVAGTGTIAWGIWRYAQLGD